MEQVCSLPQSEGSLENFKIQFTPPLGLNEVSSGGDYIGVGFQGWVAAATESAKR